MRAHEFVTTDAQHIMTKIEATNALREQLATNTVSINDRTKRKNNSR